MTIRNKPLLARLLDDERGAVAIELAVISAFVLTPLLLGITELGHRIWTVTQVDNAASAGVDYAVAANTNAAAVNATSLTVTATSSTSLGCPTSTGVTLGSTNSCSDGTSAGTYVSVTATTSYIPLFQACGGLLPQSICPNTLSATSISATALARLY